MRQKTIHLHILAIGLLTAMLCAALPTVAAAITVRHAQGETVLAARPRTILVYDLAALDTLDGLGVEVTGVPGSNMPDYLAKYRDKRYLRIGSLFEPDYETVNAAKPDLIIVGARSAAKYASLAKIAPTIDLTIQSAKFIAGARGNIETLGHIFGKDSEAAALIARIDRATARVHVAAATAGTALMVMVNGGKLTAYGSGSRFGWLHDEFGLRPAVKDVTAATHGEAISFEFILNTNPDWLVVLDRDAAVGVAGTSARQVLNNDLIAATKAAKNGRILYVDPARWYIIGGGGNALPSIAEEIATAFESKPKG